jgi:hypothetical protein
MDQKLLVAIMSFAVSSIGFYRAYKAISTGSSREWPGRIHLGDLEEYDRYDQPFKFWCNVAGGMLFGIFCVGFGIFVLLWRT